MVEPQLVRELGFYYQHVKELLFRSNSELEFNQNRIERALKLALNSQKSLKQALPSKKIAPAKMACHSLVKGKDQLKLEYLHANR